MLYVDPRAGSKNLVKPLQASLGAELVETATLEFGDIFFAGRGEGGAPLDICIEHKTIGDIVQCCRDGRFAGHQLPGMRKHYEYSWLFVEGMWRQDETGFLTTYRGPRLGWKALPGKMRASEFEKHMLTFELCGGVHVRYTNTQADSVRAIMNLYRWWSDVDLDKHTSHLAVHRPALLGEVSEFRRAVMAWPGVGLKTSTAVEQHFDSIMDAATAETSEWEKVMVDGRRLGTKTAERIVRFLTKRGE